MVIKGKRSKQHQTVTAETWRTMQEKGLARNFTVVSSSTAPANSQPPQEAQVADYSGLIAAAKEEERNGNYVEALRLAKRAQVLKPGKRIAARVERLVELSGTTFSDPELQ